MYRKMFIHWTRSDSKEFHVVGELCRRAMRRSVISTGAGHVSWKRRAEDGETSHASHPQRWRQAVTRRDATYKPRYSAASTGQVSEFSKVETEFNKIWDSEHTVFGDGRFSRQTILNPIIIVTSGGGKLSQLGVPRLSGRGMFSNRFSTKRSPALLPVLLLGTQCRTILGCRSVCGPVLRPDACGGARLSRREHREFRIIWTARSFPAVEGSPSRISLFHLM
ncbi:hypothetical protein BCR34DRAFT_361128 [Clohesyomyces aquaticus]|uniref:Uncharacterized protein n=1 Tax=Clohesyomyces aquaticus TaxID=1231657 RepID=A0A1Y2A6N0_9PLEO|nr:hypothetical protein BCR34DRAFT_361128 [Clohesyomyces aquaticus]